MGETKLDSTTGTCIKSPHDSRNISYPTYTLFCVMIACIVMFCSGFNTSSTNITSDAIRNCDQSSNKLSGTFPYCFNMGSWLWGFAVGSGALGGTIGSMCAGYAQERFGRRNALLINNFFFVLGGILIGCSINPGMWTAGRFFMGFSCGYGGVVLPTYIGEIAPTKTRGTLGSINQFYTVIGIVVVLCMSLGMSTPVGWRVLVALPGAFGLVQAVLIPLCVETPRYLVSRGRLEEARAALVKLRSGYDIEAEFEEIVQAREAAKELPKSLGFGEIMKDPYCRRNFFISIGISLLQQWSGINGVMYYSTSIFTDIYGDTAKYVTVGLCCLNVVMTIISVALIDRAGRKILLLVSSGGSAIFCVLMCVGLQVPSNGLTVAAIMMFVGSFAIGLGSIPFLIMSELMPTHAISTTTSFTLTVNWLSNFVIGLIFPTLSDVMHGYVFIIFASCCAVGFLGVLFFVRETKGKSIEELTSESHNKH